MSISPRRMSKYELLECLGQGGMAKVWRALDTQLRRYVAIKILHPDLQRDPHFTTRFKEEAEVIAALHHPNIIQIYDFQISHPAESEETLAYIVMDYVEGQTMAQYLRNTSRRGKFPSPEDLLHLFTPICLAVDYAHEKGVIHHDLKPSNILLDKRHTTNNLMGEPVLSDFSIAKLLGTPNSLSHWLLGTPSYMSPEQALGSPCDERSDIYSLSVIFYEACTGALPFVADSPEAVMMQHLNSVPLSPVLVNPHILPPLTAVILTGLSKAPESRFPTATTMVIAMAEALNLPIPEHVRQRVSHLNEMNHLTELRPVRSPAPVVPSAEAAPPLFPSQLRQHTADPPPPASSAGHQSSPGSMADTSLTPASPSAQQVPPVVIARERGSPSASSPPVSALAKARLGHPLVALLLALALIGASLGTLIYLIYNLPASPPSRKEVVGHVFFINSGQLNPDNSQGINDELLIDLHNIADPHPGHTYYGWLLGDKSLSEPPTIALGQLPIVHEAVSILYRGTPQHSNLLLYESRFLLTEEDAAVTPSTYTPDYRAWRYYAEISQAASPKDKLHFTMLDHLRHLTAESPELKMRGLHGGLDIWLLRNTQKILEWANAARDDWSTESTDLMHRHFIRILDYLDGAGYVQQDAPAAGPALLVSPRDGQVGLLGPPGYPLSTYPLPGYTFDIPVLPGYVYLVSMHLGGAVLSPDATQDQRVLADRIQVALNRVKSELEQIHQAAKQLLMMTADQLLQASTLSLLDDMVTQAQFAYSGQIDPLTRQTQGGVIQITNDIQGIATFEVKSYLFR